MRVAGCRYLSVGYDSAMAGGGVWDRFGETVRRVVSAGVAVGGYFLTGVPWEGEAERKLKLRLAASLPFSWTTFQPYSAIPGSSGSEAASTGARLGGVED
ncbi:MAG: hypothetical protein P1P84_21560, partial [Deferrisomatales bacterium]|nr:hypothetical protein [Deferrisomatales bacterium]